MLKKLKKLKKIVTLSINGNFQNYTKNVATYQIKNLTKMDAPKMLEEVQFRINKSTNLSGGNGIDDGDFKLQLYKYLKNLSETNFEDFKEACMDIFTNMQGGEEDEIGRENSIKKLNDEELEEVLQQEKEQEKEINEKKDKKKEKTITMSIDEIMQVEKEFKIINHEIPLEEFSVNELNEKKEEEEQKLNEESNKNSDEVKLSMEVLKSIEDNHQKELLRIEEEHQERVKKAEEVFNNEMQEIKKIRQNVFELLPKETKKSIKIKEETFNSGNGGKNGGGEEKETPPKNSYRAILIALSGFIISVFSKKLENDTERLKELEEIKKKESISEVEIEKLNENVKSLAKKEKEMAESLFYFFYYLSGWYDDTTLLLGKEQKLLLDEKEKLQSLKEDEKELEAKMHLKQMVENEEFVKNIQIGLKSGLLMLSIAGGGYNLLTAINTTNDLVNVGKEIAKKFHFLEKQFNEYEKACEMLDKLVQGINITKSIKDFSKEKFVSFINLSKELAICLMNCKKNDIRLGEDVE